MCVLRHAVGIRPAKGDGHAAVAHSLYIAAEARAAGNRIRPGICDEIPSEMRMMAQVYTIPAGLLRLFPRAEAVHVQRAGHKLVLVLVNLGRQEVPNVAHIANCVLNNQRALAVQL
jgi:hypothetical protein